LFVVADGFEQAECVHGDDIDGVFGGIEADADVGLGTEVIDFVGLD
jgi:hypothetical protein